MSVVHKRSLSTNVCAVKSFVDLFCYNAVLIIFTSSRSEWS